MALIICWAVKQGTGKSTVVRDRATRLEQQTERKAAGRKAFSC